MIVRNTIRLRIFSGGPLTFSNPLPASAFVDGILLGEVEDVVVDAFDAAFENNREEFLDRIQKTQWWICS